MPLLSTTASTMPVPTEPLQSDGTLSTELRSNHTTDFIATVFALVAAFTGVMFLAYLIWLLSLYLWRHSSLVGILSVFRSDESKKPTDKINAFGPFHLNLANKSSSSQSDSDEKRSLFHKSNAPIPAPDEARAPPILKNPLRRLKNEPVKHTPTPKGLRPLSLVSNPVVRTVPNRSSYYAASPIPSNWRIVDEDPSRGDIGSQIPRHASVDVQRVDRPISAGSVTSTATSAFSSFAISPSPSVHDLADASSSKRGSLLGYFPPPPPTTLHHQPAHPNPASLPCEPSPQTTLARHYSLTYANPSGVSQSPAHVPFSSDSSQILVSDRNKENARPAECGEQKLAYTGRKNHKKKQSSTTFPKTILTSVSELDESSPKKNGIVRAKRSSIGVLDIAPL